MSFPLCDYTGAGLDMNPILIRCFHCLNHSTFFPTNCNSFMMDHGVFWHLKRAWSKWLQPCKILPYLASLFCVSHPEMFFLMMNPMSFHYNNIMYAFECDLSIYRPMGIGQDFSIMFVISDVLKWKWKYAKHACERSVSNVAVATVGWTHSMALSHYWFLKYCNMQLLCLFLSCSLPPSCSLSQSVKSFHEATQWLIKYLWLLYLSPKHNVLVFSGEALRTVQEKKCV